MHSHHLCNLNELLGTLDFTVISLVPLCPSTEHSGSQWSMATLFMHLLSCIHNSSWNDPGIIINSSFPSLVSHNNTGTIPMYSCNASQHVHPYLYMHIYNIYSIFSYASPQDIITRFIKSLHAYPLNSTLYWFIKLCIQPYYGLTMTTSYRMHYYNQYHQYSLVLVIKFISTFMGHIYFYVNVV